MGKVHINGVIINNIHNIIIKGNATVVCGTVINNYYEPRRSDLIDIEDASWAETDESLLDQRETRIALLQKELATTRDEINMLREKLNGRANEENEQV